MDRKFGFGSGDARNIALLGKTKIPSMGLIRRIAELKGYVQPIPITSPAIELGIDIERSIAEMLPKAVHNPKYVSQELSRPEYEIRNHIDYESETPTKVVWVELKTSIRTLYECLDSYRQQLAWHYMLLNERKGSKEGELYLVVANPETGSVEQYQITRKDIEYELECIKIGLELLPDIWEDVNGFNEQPEICGDLLPEKLQQKAMDVADAIREIERLNQSLDAFKAQILELMQQANVKSIRFDGLSITLVPESVSSGIDSKMLKEKYPEIAKECSRVTSRGAYIKINVH